MANNKAEDKKYDQFAALAYQREIETELDKLNQDIMKWKKGEFDFKELNYKIQHNYTKRLRKIDDFYDYFDSKTEVVRAIASGILTSADIPKQMLESIKEEHENWKKMLKRKKTEKA